MKVVDLFAGAGGLSLGFEMAGFATGYALEHDKWAAETFAANMPDVRVDVCDIRNIRDSEIRKRVGFVDCHRRWSTLSGLLTQQHSFAGPEGPAEHLVPGLHPLSRCTPPRSVRD